MAGELLTVQERFEAGELLHLSDAKDMDTRIPEIFRTAVGDTYSGFSTGRYELDRARTTYGQDAVLVGEPHSEDRVRSVDGEPGARFGIYVTRVAYEAAQEHEA